MPPEPKRSEATTRADPSKRMDDFSQTRSSAPDPPDLSWSGSWRSLEARTECA
jgi:hypothetical protein